ncbi:Holliday junction branch migration protein RuvA [Fusibacter sp. JL298sf-3]
MIHFIRGLIVEIENDAVVVENQGIGYRVATSTTSISDWQACEEAVKVHTEMIVREDAISLVGFSTREELRMFQLLTSVSGVGTKVGVGILSAIPISKLTLAVQTGDVKAITAAPGVGKKTAERIILELKDKLKGFEPAASDTSMEAVQVESAGHADDALMALVALGYTKQEAQRAIAKLDMTALDTEGIIKAALKALMMQ